MESLPTSLLDLLGNTLVLRQTIPYLPIKSVLELGASSKAFRALLKNSPDTYRHVDLSNIKSATTDSSPIDVGGVSWRAERMDESLTEDDFYCGPVRGILSKLRQRQILGNINTLILDGLSVPTDLVREIVTQNNVKILSIRECKHLNERLLNQLLRYLVRPSRPDDTPKLKGLYVFGPKDSSLKVDAKFGAAQGASQTSVPIGVTSSQGAQIGAEWNQKSSNVLSTSLGQPVDIWYRSMGRVIKPTSEWAETLQACEGLVAFDAVLCRGPRHDPGAGKDYLKPAIATIALGPKGCETCESCPEGPAIFGVDAEAHLPMLAPPPIHSSTVKSAQRPTRTRSGPDSISTTPRLILRCEDCLRGRWCERCNKWWCEDCYREPVSRAAISEELRESGYDPTSIRSPFNAAGAPGESVKVYFNVCVESCLVSELLPVIDGMWA